MFRLPWMRARSPAVHLLPPAFLLLLLSALLHELSGIVGAAVTVGMGGLTAGSVEARNFMPGSIQPVRQVEFTDRDCDQNALSRIPDDRYCDKYFVCSNGKYVGLFCPVGMAFDYGLQECRLKASVDCSTRPLFSGGILPSTSGTLPTTTTTASTLMTTTMNPILVTPPSTTTEQPIRMSPVPPNVDTTTTSRPILPWPEHQVTMMPGNVMTIPFGAKVIIPFGSTIFLPPGSQIQMQSPILPQPQQQHGGHKHHRRSSTSSDGIAEIVGNRHWIPSPTTRPPSDDTDGHHETTDVDNTETDYYFEDQPVVDDSTSNDEVQVDDNVSSPDYKT